MLRAGHEVYVCIVGWNPSRVWLQVRAQPFPVIAVRAAVHAVPVGLANVQQSDSASPHPKCAPSVRQGYTHKPVYVCCNTRSTGVLTLGSALINNYALGQDVFQFASLGLPTYWTIWGGYIYHWPAISSSYNNRNYYLDYYKALTQITSDSDQIVLPDPTVVQYYLAWKFLLKLNNGEETDASKAVYSNYILRREKMKQKESINRNFILNPDIGDNFYGNIYS